MYYRYWEHSPIRPSHFGIRDTRYKLIFFYGQPLGMRGASKDTTPPAWEFFNLQKDPKEIQNAINDVQYSAIIKQMKNELLRLKNEAGDSDEGYPEMKEIFSKSWKP